MQRLAARLAEGLRVETPRLATRPSRSAKRTRVDDKRRRGETKRLRARPADD
jgi:ribosome-associated protein